MSIVDPSPDEVDRPVPQARIAELVTETPSLAIHLPTVRRNIERMAARASAAGVHLRPHAKTHKMPEIARMQLAAGSRGIQVAKLGEAEVMADAGVEDILIGYPIVGAEKLRRLRLLADRVRLTVALDSFEVAAGISRAMASAVRIAVLVEVDTGLHRVGVPPGDAAIDLLQRLTDLPGIDVVGLLTHEGHVYGAAHTVGEIEEMTGIACRLVVETAEAARGLGVPVDIVSVGSSATARFALAVPGVTEIRPGTYVFNDMTQVAQGAATLADVAAVIIATVVSCPAPDRAVIDAGTKALSSDQLIVPAPERTYGSILGHPAWRLERASEEHGVIVVPARTGPRVGDRLAILPNHVCPVVNLFDEVVVIDDDRIADRWHVAARGRMH